MSYFILYAIKTAANAFIKSPIKNGITPIVNASINERFNMSVRPKTPLKYIIPVHRTIASKGVCDSLPTIWAAKKKPII